MVRPQIDAESNKELDQWNETLRNEVMKLCQENGFNTGFFEGSDNNSCIDAYELKVIIISFFFFLSPALINTLISSLHSP